MTETSASDDLVGASFPLMDLMAEKGIALLAGSLPAIVETRATPRPGAMH